MNCLRLPGNLPQVADDAVSLGDAPRTMRAVPPVKEDCRDVSIGEKAELLLAIEKAADQPLVTSRRANYLERIENVRFMDSSGSEYSYEICRSGFSVMAVAARNGTVQMGYERDHTIHGFNLRHRDDRGRKAAETAVALLDAGLQKAGRCTPSLTRNLPAFSRTKPWAMRVKVTSSKREIQSSKAGPARRSAMTFSPLSMTHPFPNSGLNRSMQKGSRSASTEIIRAGKVNAFLHNRQTLAAVGNGVAGHARAMPGESPLVRMSNTFIEAGDATGEEIFSECKNGIFLAGFRGGQVDPGRGVFQFNAEYGYLIENGERTRMVRDVSLSGEILSTLHGIVLCGKERVMHPGYCGKGGQSVPVSDGAPFVLLRDAVVGGSGVD